ncbi:hypothetical protein SAMN04487910_0369 [Aquimarina amphilecti]|uniref:Lipocalin-like domain-containing protein n=1 Tax=Aquimarina amphilecti TaxID=1038014 RepID=A0A1H7GGJ1_AQUAM|nr:hypothetical protein [Aquimarina amphilecti]SEK37241.1 hypothetical protein SAMN04487910_0369 [Aquimarina amphilecti]
MKHFCIVLLSIVLLGCSSDDDNNAQESTIAGAWNLVNVSGGVTGVDEDIEKGAIVWDFNETTGMVTINNTITDASFNVLLDSGTYTYSVSAPADADLLIVNEVNVGSLNLANGAFTVEETFDDGFTFRFER